MKFKNLFFLLVCTLIWCPASFSSSVRTLGVLDSRAVEKHDEVLGHRVLFLPCRFVTYQRTEESLRTPRGIASMVVVLFDKKLLASLQDVLRTALCFEFCFIPGETCTDLSIIELKSPDYAIEPPVKLIGDGGTSVLVERSINSTRVRSTCLRITKPLKNFCCRSVSALWGHTVNQLALFFAPYFVIFTLLFVMNHRFCVGSPLKATICLSCLLTAILSV